VKLLKCRACFTESVHSNVIDRKPGRGGRRDLCGAAGAYDRRRRQGGVKGWKAACGCGDDLFSAYHTYVAAGDLQPVQLKVT
jgi:hypothetical protein